MSIDDSQPSARHPFLIAARRKGRSTPSLLISDNIAYIEPRTGAESAKTFAMTNSNAPDSWGEIDAPIGLVADIFRQHGYTVYDGDALDELKKERARKLIAPKV